MVSVAGRQPDERIVADEAEKASGADEADGRDRGGRSWG